jgi:hypothetical protein
MDTHQRVLAKVRNPRSFVISRLTAAAAVKVQEQKAIRKRR